MHFVDNIDTVGVDLLLPYEFPSKNFLMDQNRFQGLWISFLC